jgi:hypothetical protein
MKKEAEGSVLKQWAVRKAEDFPVERIGEMRWDQVKQVGELLASGRNERNKL